MTMSRSGAGIWLFVQALTRNDTKPDVALKDMSEAGPADERRRPIYSLGIATLIQL